MFQPCNIVTDAAKALTEALQHIKMDEVFKHDYMIFAFARLSLIEPPTTFPDITPTTTATAVSIPTNTLSTASIQGLFMHSLE